MLFKYFKKWKRSSFFNNCIHYVIWPNKQEVFITLLEKNSFPSIKNKLQCQTVLNIHVWSRATEEGCGNSSLELINHERCIKQTFEKLFWNDMLFSQVNCSSKQLQHEHFKCMLYTYTGILTYNLQCIMITSYILHILHIFVFEMPSF